MSKTLFVGTRRRRAAVSARGGLDGWPWAACLAAILTAWLAAGPSAADTAPVQTPGTSSAESLGPIEPVPPAAAEAAAAEIAADEAARDDVESSGPSEAVEIDDPGEQSPAGLAPEPLKGLPDPDTLRRMVSTAPESLGPLSVGTPDAGVLLNGVQLRDGPLWRVGDRRDCWATDETIAFLTTAIEAVNARYPGSPPIVIGDMSPPDGGRAGRHRSHQSGRDADVGWYFRDTAESRLETGTATNLDLPRCWALVRALVTETDVDRIFIDRSIQNLLFRYALESGEDRRWLETVFSYPGGRSDTLVQHERRHKNHLHVRFFNQRAQEWGRVAYPLLVEAKLLPPPVILYRARRGDTLSIIARRYGAPAQAIRAANGMRSSFIRAGRRYRIPVRLAAARALPPVVVRPRRLPPLRAASADTAH